MTIDVVPPLAETLVPPPLASPPRPLLGFHLERPLVSLDVEATGPNPETDHIIELGLVRLDVDGARSSSRWLINPGCPIPAASTAIHKITDDDVASAPRFEDVAEEIAGHLRGVDLVGYNLRVFDLPVLRRAFREADVAWPCEGARVIDVFHLYRARETRGLADAVRFYLGRDHQGAHAAESDAAATLDVLRAQLGRYLDLPPTLAELDVATGGRQPDWATECGRLRRDPEGRIVVAFGRHTGQLLASMDLGFLYWVLERDFPEDVKAIFREHLPLRSPRPLDEDDEDDDRDDGEPLDLDDTDDPVEPEEPAPQVIELHLDDQVTPEQLGAAARLLRDLLNGEQDAPALPHASALVQAIETATKDLANAAEVF